MGMGGAESLLAEIVDRQGRDGHDVAVVTFKNVTKVPLPDGVRLYSANYAGGTPRKRIGAVLRLASVLRKLQADIVHSHMLHANLLTRMLRPFVGFPVLINTVHAAFETDNAFYRLCYRALDRLANVTAFVSRAAQRQYAEEGLTPANRSAVVYNGIDLERFGADETARAATRREFGVPDDAAVLLAIGRLTELKDYPNLFLAFDKVAKAAPNTLLLIVGDGELSEPLKRLARSSEWSDRIIFAGLRYDVPALLAAADMLVLASSYEGFGLVLAEAMACGVPVVTTNCGGTAEVVGDAGSIVPKKDPEALAAAIIETLQLPAERLDSQLLRARQRVEEMFSIDAAMAGWYRLYDEHARVRGPAGAGQ